MRLSSFKSNVGVSMLVVSSVFPIYVAIKNFSSLVFRTNYSESIPSGYVVTHVAFANLLASGVTILVLALCWHSKKSAWLLRYLFFLYVWVGFNDTFAIFGLYQNDKVSFPFPLVPTVLGLLGLFLDRKKVMKSAKLS